MENAPVNRADADGHSCGPPTASVVFEGCLPAPALAKETKSTGQQTPAQNQKSSWWAALTGSVAAGVARISPAAARRVWEAANPGQKVPFDTVRNRFYDMAHVKALADQGTNAAANLKPQEHGEHFEEHMANGDFARWASRAKDAAKSVEGLAEDMGEAFKSGAQSTGRQATQLATEVVEHPGVAAEDAVTVVIEAVQTGEIPPL